MSESADTLRPSCHDRCGMVAAVATALAALVASIVEPNQFWYRQANQFFLPTAYIPEGVGRKALELTLNPSIHELATLETCRLYPIICRTDCSE